MQEILTRRSILSMAQFAPFFAVAKPVQPVQTPANGVVLASDYPSLQAAADAAFGTVANPHGTAGVMSNRELKITPGPFYPPSSGAPVLDLRYLHGGRIIGSGRFVSQLIQPVAGVPVIRTNGCGFSRFEGMLLQGAPGAPCFELTWDGSPGGPALQSNTFEDMHFYGGSHGIRIGYNGSMGSENLFSNCFWLLNTTAGLSCQNFNALQQTIIGGNFQTCGIAIDSGGGSVPIIHGVGFQQSSVCDIQTNNSASNAMSIMGCRSESRHFILNNAGQSMHIAACRHTSPGLPGFFINSGNGDVTISSCSSVYGQAWLRGTVHASIEQTQFNRLDGLRIDGLTINPPTTLGGYVEVRNVALGQAAPITEIVHRRYFADSNWITRKYDYVLTEVL